MTEERVEMYCQNPECKYPLISKVNYVANIDGAIVHPGLECVQSYVHHESSKNTDILFAEKNFITYSQAEKLARKGKVKYSKLERGTKQ
jgi:hypothetical protein